MDEPRAHHHLFAHRVIPDLAFDDPLAFMGALISHDARQRMVQVWDRLGEDVAREGKGEPIPSEGLEVRSGLHDGRPCAVIRLPRPLGITECWFLAAFLERIPTREEVEGAPPPELSYFTLERAWNRGQKGESTVICRWTRGSHQSFGAGPEPDADRFLAEALRIVRNEGKASS